MLQHNLLQGNSVYLDAMTEEDLLVVKSWYGSTDFLRHLDAVPAAPRSLHQVQEWYKSRVQQANGFLFAIRSLQDERLLGYVELDSILWSEQVSWIVIAIGDETDRGHGFGRDALQTLLRFAFQELNLRRLQLTVFSYNKNAIKLYESLGFQREGTFREFVHRDSCFHDMYLYGLLQREWSQVPVLSTQL